MGNVRYQINVKYFKILPYASAFFSFFLFINYKYYVVNISAL